MKRPIKGTALTAFVTLATVVAMFPVESTSVLAAESSDLTAYDLTTDFLSNVAGVNMTEYALTPPPAGWEKLNITENYYKTIKEMARIDFYGPSFSFNSSDKKFHTLSILRHGQLSALKIYPSDDVRVSDLSSIELLNQTKTILQRYQTYFARVYNRDASFLEPMQNILNNLISLSPTNLTIDNINFQIAKTESRTRFQWIYVENGVSMGNWKRVEIAFRENSFESFADSWSHYVVGGLSKISSEEATKIALEAAQKVELHIVQNGTLKTVNFPDLSNAFHDVSFHMFPLYDSDIASFPSAIARNSSTLYPFWQFHFYFNETIAGNEGIHVSVLGDTGEVYSAGGFGYLGTPNTSDAPSGTSDFGYIDDLEVPNGKLPSNQTLEQQQTEPDFRLDLVLAVVVILAAILLFSLGYWKKRKRQSPERSFCE